MSSWRAFCETLHVSALGIWVGAITLSGATAAIAFPTLKKLGVQIPELAAFPLGQDKHYLFAAGAIAERVFLVSDILCFMCAMAAGATLILSITSFKTMERRKATLFRALGFGVALASLGAMLIIVTPQLNGAFRQHLLAIKAGDAVMAAAHKAASDQLHPVATVLMFLQIMGGLIALWAAGWTMSERSGREAKEAAAPASKYPEPELRRKRPA